MTTYVITIPGTFLTDVTDESRNVVVERLRSADPQQTTLGEAEDLDILSVNENNTFNVRLEIEADDNPSAEASAKEKAEAALRAAGFSEDDARLGRPTVTGIDI
ncbi:hypothetical protein QR77_40475 [Streptomyces sp. 150FB]|uniref:hypothetical protein n=1 Tax=Streptomyces sp. 150FB TaxID=1576605 RepID=UPI0005891D09|nr:hypothetical protein [Streptomyces sp. 150FB]KIF78364.1 hypothetical protein QR77_40475 [Streptomyces sp. 150FB]